MANLDKPSPLVGTARVWIQRRSNVMDGRHVDQIAKALADGVSRRATLKAFAAALGLSTVGVLGRSRTTVAQQSYAACEYSNGSRTRVRCLTGITSAANCP